MPGKALTDDEIEARYVVLDKHGGCYKAAALEIGVGVPALKQFLKLRPRPAKVSGTRVPVFPATGAGRGAGRLSGNFSRLV